MPQPIFSRIHTCSLQIVSESTRQQQIINTIKTMFGLSTTDQQPKFDDDDVYPAMLLDDTKAQRDMVLHWTFHFNDVLDTEKLRTSLATLIDIGDWRKLGGRYKINVSAAQQSCVYI